MTEVRIVNVAIARRNRNNRKKGRRTSHELADYLGGEDVEGMGWKWDVQGKGWRLQSKRDAVGRSPLTRAMLIDAIYPGDHLRGLFEVPPRARLTSGTVTMFLREWVGWHGWEVPNEASLSLAGEDPLVSMPLPVFRDWHIGIDAETAA